MGFEKTINFNNGEIFYRVTGQGPAVVLIHGVPADGDLWEEQCKALTTFKFIVPDLPGSGRSKIILDMSIGGMAEAIKAILDEEKITRAAMIGHSMGGYVSLAFAERYRDRLLGLGLFHSTAYADREERKTIRRKGIDFIEKNGAYEFLKTLIPNLFSPGNRQINFEGIEHLLIKAKNFSSQALISYYEAMLQRPDRRSVLENFEIPLLFIAGTHDTAVPLNDSLEQSHMSQTCHFHILAQSGHMGMIEETEKTNSTLSSYLFNLSIQ